MSIEDRSLFNGGSVFILHQQHRDLSVQFPVGCRLQIAEDTYDSDRSVSKCVPEVSQKLKRTPFNASKQSNETMTVTKEDPDIVVNAEDLPVVTAVGIEGDDEKKANEKLGGGANEGGGPPIPPGHARFYCNKCRAVS